MYSTDNGPHMNSWPDGAMTPFRSEKNTNWEGAYRVPAMFRWPGKIKPDQVSNEIVSHLDMLPTILAIAGDPDVKEKLLKGYTVGDMTYKSTSTATALSRISRGRLKRARGYRFSMSTMTSS